MRWNCGQPVFFRFKSLYFPTENEFVRAVDNHSFFGGKNCGKFVELWKDFEKIQKKIQKILYKNEKIKISTKVVHIVDKVIHIAVERRG